MSRQYPILRSGFIGLSMAGLKEPKEAFDKNVAAILNKSRLLPDDDYFFHESIQRLFVMTLKEGYLNILNKLEFQEQILKAAVEAFGTKNFWDWIDLQAGKPTITSVHEAFIIETLNYISGVPRKTSTQQWIRLLEAGTSENRGTIRGSKYFETLNEIRRSGSVPGSLGPLFLKWIRQEHGFYDFICSLEAIFGNRRTLNQSV